MHIGDLYKKKLLTALPLVIWKKRRSFCSTSDGFPKGAEQMNVLNPDDMQPVSSSEIRKFLTSNNLSFTEGFTCYVTTCPRHSKRKVRLSELDKLYINTKTGYFVCKSCNRSGSWADFQENTEKLIELINQKKRLMPECLGSLPSEETGDDARKASDFYRNSLPISGLFSDQCLHLKHGLGIENLSNETLEHYGVKVTETGSGLVFPVFSSSGQVIGVKSSSMVVAQVEGLEKKRLISRTIPRVDYNGLFGWNLINSSQDDIILTSSEFDAMAIYQETGCPAVALPKGISILPQKILPHLEQFQKIIIWFGADVKAWDAARQFARKLVEKRCSLIRPDENHPNALTALQRKLSLRSILKTAKPVQHKSIVSFRNLRKDVYAQLAESEQVAGVKWQRYPHLNNLLKGHRRGELTVFTGPTGSGKTTFISDYSLDLCMQGVNTLWGSFEINNVRLLKTMVTQFAQMNLSKNLDKFDEVADRFEQLPMYFMTFHGQENIKRVIETMSHAVYVHDITHVIVDNLQFMIGVDDMKSVDRFYRQDQVISSFRKFVTHMNCHVTLVIHPRKERDSEDLTVSSIFGSAKVSQEADNILILQDKRLTTLRGRKYVQVAKNRFDGELGVMLLKFDKDTLSFAMKGVKEGNSQKNKVKQYSSSDDDDV